MFAQKLPFELKLIVCMDNNDGIGRNGKIPWSCPSDLKQFKQLTSGSTVLMGYQTWLSLPMYPKGLPKRRNIVLTRNHLTDILLKEIGTDNVFADLHQAIQSVDGTLWIIGGAQIYREVLTWYVPTQIYITRIVGQYHCNAFFPSKLISPHYILDEIECPEKIVTQDTETVNIVTFQTMTFQNNEEKAYLNLFQKVLCDGNWRGDRTGVGTISLFAPPDLKFSLRNGSLPVLTTKKMFTRGVLAELLWFMSGSTDSRILESQGVHIWKGNTSTEFLQKRGLHYEQGDIGAGYGFQWRHFGAVYQGMNQDYTGQGIDQLANLVRDLRQDPESRRLLLCSWNTVDLDKMALPPCHLLYQCYVRQNSQGQKLLSAKMYQRSADSFLGVPFNIVSYALLTHILAALTGMDADELTMSFGDYHIYQTHLEQVREQLRRPPYPFPKIRFTRDLIDLSPDQVRATDIHILRSSSHPKIVADMSV